MGLLESSYIKKYNSLMRKMDNLNKRNVRGYDTFKEYVLSDEIMISYFRELKELEQKIPRLHVDSFDTFKNNVLEQLKEIYLKKVKEIEKEKDLKEQYRRFLELRYDIKDSYGHCCNPELDILMEDINSKINLFNIDDINNVKKERHLKYFDKEYNDYMRLCKYNVDEAIDCYDNNACINCGCVFDQKIKSSKTCPECKTKNIVRSDIYSKNKLIVSSNTLSSFEKYEKDIREILYFERIMNQKQYIYDEYSEDIYKLRSNNNSARDIMWSISNKASVDYENLAYKLYMQSLKLNKYDMYMQGSEAIRLFRTSNLEYLTMFNIADYKEKKDIAYDLLMNIIYRDVQISILEFEIDKIHNIEKDFIISNIHSNIIIEFIKKYNIDLMDFKKRFIETPHHLLVNTIDNMTAWDYISKSIERQKYWNEKNKNDN